MAGDGDDSEGEGATANTCGKVPAEVKIKSAPSRSAWGGSDSSFSWGDAAWGECQQGAVKDSGEDVERNNNGGRQASKHLTNDGDGRSAATHFRWSTGGTVDVNKRDVGDKNVMMEFRSRRDVGENDVDRGVDGWRISSVGSEGGGSVGEGQRTPPCTSRSPSGSPGLTPLRGRSRRGWWRRRRESYPTGT